jgi:hypothetical protein
VHFGLCIWGKEALPSVIRLVVLEADAPVPHSDGEGGPIAVIARQRDETPEEFLQRLERKLSRSECSVGSACLSLNRDAGESARRARWLLASRMAKALQPTRGVLHLLHAESPGDRSDECLCLAESLSRKYTDLVVSYPGQNEDLRDEDDEVELPSGIRHSLLSAALSEVETAPVHTAHSEVAA